MTLKNRIISERSVILYVILILLLLQLAIALFTDGFALSFDEAMWYYIGRNWFRNGLSPYMGGVDNKSPLIFVVFGLSDRLFGVNYWFPRVLGAVCQSVSVYFIYKIARHVHSHRAGLLAAVVYGLSLLWHTTGGKYVSYTETYEVMFVILAFYNLLVADGNKGIFIGGLFAGAAFMFRLTAAFVILGILISCFRQKRSNAVIFCGGLLTTLAVLCITFLFAGISPQDVVTYALFDNFGAGSATDHSLLWKWHNFSTRLLMSGMLLFYPPLIGYLVIKKRVDRFVLWFIMALIGICAVGIFDVVHLKEVLPPLALMCAFSILFLVDRYQLSLKLCILIVAIIFLPGMNETWSVFKETIAPGNQKALVFCAPPYFIPDEGTRKKLGRWVRDNTSLNDEVYVAGFGAQVQVYSERISPTIYFNATQTPLAKSRFYRDMRQNKPAMILVPLFPEYKETVGLDMRDFVDSLVTKNYVLQTCRYNYNVYRMKR